MTTTDITTKPAHEIATDDVVFAGGWHGGGQVLESCPSGFDGWKITFDAPVVNPPGVWYGKKDAPVQVTA